MALTEINKNGIPVFTKDVYKKIVGDIPNEEKITDEGFLELFFDDGSEPSEFQIDDNLLPSSPAMHVNQFSWEILKERGIIDALENLFNFSEPENTLELVDLLIEKSKPGKWTRVSWKRKVSYHDQIDWGEVGLVFDTETFVKAERKLGSPMPIVGQALSFKAMWMWLHESWDGETPYYSTFVSLGETLRVLIAHNAIYDYNRILEKYTMNPFIYALDTMSMVNSVHGLDGTSRKALLSKKNTPFKKSREGLGCMKSLVASYNFVIGEPKLKEADKKARNIFVEAEDFQEFIDNKYDLLKYSMLDVIYTFRLGKELYNRFIEWSGGHSVLFGHITVIDSILPIMEDREEWIDRCDSLVEENKQKIIDIISPYAKDLEDNINKYNEENDSELFKLDWRQCKPKGWRKKTLPEGWPIRSRWYDSFLKGEFKLTGLDLSRLLQLRYNGFKLQYFRGLGWHYYDDSGKQTKLPHKSGNPKDNVGNPLSSDSLRWIEDKKGNILENPLITSDLVDIEVLHKIMRLLDANTTWSGFGDRVKSKIFSYDIT